MNKRFNRLMNLTICKICGEEIIYDAWCCEAHMQHKHPELANKNNWYNKSMRLVSGDEILKILNSNKIIRKQYKNKCNCLYCNRVRIYSQEKREAS